MKRLYHQIMPKLQAYHWDIKRLFEDEKRKRLGDISVVEP